MVLFNILGELGSGKTATLVALTLKNWFYRRQKVYSNFHLFRIPYVYIDAINRIDEAKDGWLALDEFWTYCDARMSLTRRNRFVADILRRSRKRNLTYCMTVQVADSVDRRVRKIMDFSAYPMLTTNENVCKVLIFRGGYPKRESFMKSFYFKTNIIFNLYETDEEIDTEDEIKIPEQTIVFQENYLKEHGFWCKCNFCNTRFFKTWEEADKFSEKWWLKNFDLLSGVF